MTLQDILESGLVKDDHEIRLSLSGIGAAALLRGHVSGKWFEDSILKRSDWKVERVEFYGGGCPLWDIEISEDLP